MNSRCPLPVARCPLLQMQCTSDSQYACDAVLPFH